MKRVILISYILGTMPLCLTAHQTIRWTKLVKKLCILILAVAFQIAGPKSSALAQSITLSAVDALDVCTRPDPSWIDFCNGFFQASLDSIYLRENMCVPAGTTRTDLAELYERNAPAVIASSDDAQLLAAVNVAAGIFRQAFSCN